MNALTRINWTASRSRLAEALNTTVLSQPFLLPQ